MRLFCQGCGSEFEGKGTDRYCSDECRESTRKIRDQALKEGARDMLPKTCPFCGKTFIPPHRQDQIYCSDVCRDKAKWEKKKRVLTERACLVCGKEFMPTVNKQVCCSPECTFKKIYLKNPDKKKQQAREYRLKNIDRIRAKDRERRAKNKEQKNEYDRMYKDKIRFSGNKEPALNRDGYKCSECGAETRLAGHHIDGSGQTENRNDEVDNLQILCPSCHGKKQKGTIRKPEIHLTVICQGCGIEFDTTQERIDSGRGKFHSKECQYAYKTKTKTVTLNCEHCGIEFTVPLSRYKRGKAKYHNMECRKAAGYAWTKYNRTEYNEQQKALQ